MVDYPFRNKRDGILLYIHRQECLSACLSNVRTRWSKYRISGIPPISVRHYSSSDSLNHHVRLIRSVTHGLKCYSSQIVAAVLYCRCDLNNSHFCQCVHMPSSPMLGVGSGQPIISGSSKPLDHKAFRGFKLRGHCAILGDGSPSLYCTHPGSPLFTRPKGGHHPLTHRGGTCFYKLSTVGIFSRIHRTRLKGLISLLA